MGHAAVNSLRALPEYRQCLWLPAPGQGGCPPTGQHREQAPVFAKAPLGIYSFPRGVVVGIGCAFTTCNYMVPFIPKDF